MAKQTENTRKEYVRNNTYSTDLAALIADGKIKPGRKVYAKNLGKEYEGTVHKSGAVAIKGLDTFPTLSQAGRAIRADGGATTRAALQVNGWAMFKIKVQVGNKHQSVSLGSLRAN